jgi:ComF family protein
MRPRNLIGAIEDAIAPLRCVFCGTRTRDDEQFVCCGCFTDLPWTRCPVLPDVAGLSRVVAPVAYAFPVDAAIRAFKFRRRLFYGPALAQLLGTVRGELPDDIDAVLPVPLHWRRKWWRGFNQALEIARPVARQLGLPLVYHVMRRRSTPPQSGLTATQRATNLRQAFHLRTPVHARHVLIVDDVITTGETVKQLAQTLLDNGVDKVSAIAVARAGER